MSHIIRNKGEESGAYRVVREHFFVLQNLY